MDYKGVWGSFPMSGVRMLHFFEDWWKFIQIQRYYMYTMALRKCTARVRIYPKAFPTNRYYLLEYQITHMIHHMGISNDASTTLSRRTFMRLKKCTSKSTNSTSSEDEMWKNYNFPSKYAPPTSQWMLNAKMHFTLSSSQHQVIFSFFIPLGKVWIYLQLAYDQFKETDRCFCEQISQALDWGLFIRKLA